MSNPAPSALPAHFPREISREQMAVLPIRRYEGEVVVVETPRDLDRAWEDLAQEKIVGWDTETRLAFRVGETYLPCLVQAATARAVYLFPLPKMDFSGVVGGLFAEPGIVKVGISVKDDLKKLALVIALEPTSVLDAGTVARRHGMEQTGLRNLAGIFLGFRVPKGAKTTNWAAPRLSAQQINYAATDAWTCRELYLRFRALGMV
ncbi:MAG: 3'-5' exonuclease domain-containing protein 2 [Betaproteobacteria bacterium]|nr:3'-5' exonuclease domain-containing protein 2 [Betaproteobacteria bacterium]